MKKMIIISLCVFPVLAIANDTAMRLCADYGYQETICNCAAPTFLEGLSEEDAALYHRVGNIFLAHRSAGMQSDGAWDQTINDIAKQDGESPTLMIAPVLSLRNEHLRRIHHCGGAL